MSDPDAAPPAACPPAACPVCGKPLQSAFRPFCSARCGEIDLGRWFTGAYRVPGPPAERDDSAPEEETT